MKNDNVVGRASLGSVRVSPRKARLVADMIRGQHAAEALRRLEFSDKKSARFISKLLMSAVANAQNSSSVDVDLLFVSSIRVDMGRTLKRFLPRAQGRASGIKKRHAHVHLELAQKKSTKGVTP